MTFDISESRLSIKQRMVPVQRLLPSIVTILALCSGITSIRYALDEKFHIAAALIICAAFLDGIDGFIARALNATTKFGAQLDSLADVCSFGVAPGLVMYIWSLRYIPYKGIGWTVILFYIMCSTLRLARFNVQNGGDPVQSSSNTSKKHVAGIFIGVPMPMAAGLAIMPMICTFEIAKYSIILLNHWFVAIYMTIIACLMISRVPICSFRIIAVPKHNVSLLLGLLGGCFAGIIMAPWVMLPIVGVMHIALIPLSTYIINKATRSRYD